VAVPVSSDNPIASVYDRHVVEATSTIIPTSLVSRRPWLAPVATGALGLVGLAYIGLNNPADGGAFVPCPFHQATGLWCPGCGITRATHLLLNGDVAGALAMNLLLPAVIVLAGYAWGSWLWRSFGRPALPSLARIPSGVWFGIYGFVLAFGVLRNLGPFAVLAP
jgi:hypothetical protein